MDFGRIYYSDEGPHCVSIVAHGYRWSKHPFFDRWEKLETTYLYEFSGNTFRRAGCQKVNVHCSGESSSDGFRQTPCMLVGQAWEPYEALSPVLECEVPESIQECLREAFENW